MSSPASCLRMEHAAKCDTQSHNQSYPTQAKKLSSEVLGCSFESSGRNKKPTTRTNCDDDARHSLSQKPHKVHRRIGTTSLKKPERVLVLYSTRWSKNMGHVIAVFFLISLVALMGNLVYDPTLAFELW